MQQTPGFEIKGFKGNKDEKEQKLEAVSPGRVERASAPRTAPQHRGQRPSTARGTPPTGPRPRDPAHSPPLQTRAFGLFPPPRTFGKRTGILHPGYWRGFLRSGAPSVPRRQRKDSAAHLCSPAKTLQLPASISTYRHSDFPGKLRGVGSAIQDGLKQLHNHPAHAPRM